MWVGLPVGLEHGELRYLMRGMSCTGGRNGNLQRYYLRPQLPVGNAPVRHFLLFEHEPCVVWILLHPLSHWPTLRFNESNLRLSEAKFKQYPAQCWVRYWSRKLDRSRFRPRTILEFRRFGGLSRIGVHIRANLCPKRLRYRFARGQLQLWNQIPFCDRG